MKLGLIIPYRDRSEHLKIFIPIITECLKKQNIEYKIIVVNQDNDRLFNKCKLMNIGAELLYDDVDYFCFHDVDYIPENTVSYKLDNDIIQNARIIIENRLNKIKNNEFYCGMNFNKYFNNNYYYSKQGGENLGGVSIIKKEIWLDNKWNEIFEGWGFEDAEYLHRLKFLKKYTIHNTINNRYICLHHNNEHPVISRCPNFIKKFKYFNYLKDKFKFIIYDYFNPILEFYLQNNLKYENRNNYELLKSSYISGETIPRLMRFDTPYVINSTEEKKGYTFISVDF